jgi:predicted HD superfamily hydrolase involved in NAD metabolism
MVYMLQIDRERLVEATRSQMPGKRWEHTLGVIETSVRLAERYGADTGKADLAALLHDYCKYWPAEKLRAIVLERSMPSDLLEYDIQLLHAPVAAQIVQEEFGIDDMEVLDAIRYHTSGRPGMTLLDKIVCLADYMEPNRDFPGVDQIRLLAERSLEEALIAGFDSTIQFLLTKRQKIYPMTVHSRNALIHELRPKVQHP